MHPVDGHGDVDRATGARCDGHATDEFFAVVETANEDAAVGADGYEETSVAQIDIGDILRVITTWLRGQLEFTGEGELGSAIGLPSAGVSVACPDEPSLPGDRFTALLAKDDPSPYPRPPAPRPGHEPAWSSSRAYQRPPGSIVRWKRSMPTSRSQTPSKMARVRLHRSTPVGAGLCEAGEVWNRDDTSAQPGTVEVAMRSDRHRRMKIWLNKASAKVLAQSFALMAMAPSGDRSIRAIPAADHSIGIIAAHETLLQPRSSPCHGGRPFKIKVPTNVKLYKDEAHYQSLLTEFPQ